MFSLTKRHAFFHPRRIGFAQNHTFGQVAHPFTILAAGKVAATRAGRKYFTGSGDLKPLCDGLLCLTTGNRFRHTTFLSSIFRLGIVGMKLRILGVIFVIIQVRFLRIFPNPFFCGQRC